MSRYRDVIEKARRTESQQGSKSDKKEGVEISPKVEKKSQQAPVAQAPVAKRPNTTPPLIKGADQTNSDQGSGLFEGLQDVAQQLQSVIGRLQNVLDKIEGGEDGSSRYSGSLLEGLQDIAGEIESVTGEIPDVLSQIQGVLDGQDGGNVQSITRPFHSSQGGQ